MDARLVHFLMRSNRNHVTRKDVQAGLDVKTQALISLTVSLRHLPEEVTDHARNQKMFELACQQLLGSVRSHQPAQVASAAKRRMRKHTAINA
jgi:hypothetical protein